MVHIVKLKYTNKNKINWKKVENELKRFINKSYINNSTNKCIHIDNHSIDELTHSNYTINLKGRLRLIKANLVFYLDLIISEMDNERWKEDIGNKHKKIAKNGWYRYDVYFTFPVRNEYGEYIDTTNYRATCIVRITEDNQFYLYDIIDIKK